MMGLLAFYSHLEAASLPTSDKGCSHRTATCPYQKYKIGSNPERFNAIKLKRLEHITVDTNGWSGNTSVSGATPSLDTGNSGVDFCILAYDDLSSGSNRRIHDYTITAIANNNVELKASDGKVIPITLVLTRDADSSDRVQFADTPSSVRINATSIAGSSCLNREYSIVASAQPSDILEAGSFGPFKGTFSVKVESHTNESANLIAEHSFDVTLTAISPFYKVSGLSDVSLSSSDVSSGWLYQDMNFCVFALAESAYGLSLDSRNNPAGSFELEGSGVAIPYRASFSEIDKGQWESADKAGFVEEGQGSQYLDCRDFTNGVNAVLRIEIKESDLVGTGVFSDVMEVTVAPK